MMPETNIGTISEGSFNNEPEEKEKFNIREVEFDIKFLKQIQIGNPNIGRKQKRKLAQNNGLKWKAYQAIENEIKRRSNLGLDITTGKSRREK